MDFHSLTIIGSLFIFGLLGGFSHCTGMCGPFVLTQVSNRLGNISINEATYLKKLKGIALLPYHFGRITTYSLIALGSFFLAQNLKNELFFKQISGLFLIVGALIFFNSTIAKIKFSSKIKIKIGNRFFLSAKNIINSLFLNPTGFKNYLLGIILGFIPCGLVYGAIATSISLGSATNVLLAMIAFGIGTIPALFITACGGFWFFNKSPKYISHKYLGIFIKIILLINVITLLIMAISLIFNKI